MHFISHLPIDAMSIQLHVAKLKPRSVNHLIRASPSRELLLTNLPQLINSRSLACDDTLRHLCRSADSVLPHDSISSRHSLNSDNTDSRIVLGTIVLSVTEVAEPGFESGRVVFLDGVTVGDDGGFAGDGGPFAGAVKEGDVDVRVGVDVVGLAGFGVGVEDEVNATGFLEGLLVTGMQTQTQNWMCRGGRWRMKKWSRT